MIYRSMSIAFSVKQLTRLRCRSPMPCVLESRVLLLEPAVSQRDTLFSLIYCDSTSMQTECRPIELKPDLSPLGRSIREEIRKDLIVVTTSSVKAVELCYLQPTQFRFPWFLELCYERGWLGRLERQPRACVMHSVTGSDSVGLATLLYTRVDRPFFLEMSVAGLSVK